MKEMLWDEYYAGFYDWSLSTQKSYSYRLSDFGASEGMRMGSFVSAKYSCGFPDP